MTGAWALKIVATVTWPATGVVAAGTGTTHQVNLWALVQGATQTGTSISVTVLPCGITLPDFQSVLAGTYGVIFPNTLFDHTPSSYLPATSATLNVGSTSPGATFTSAAEANLLGISFANPTTAAWPNVTTALADQVDMDGDMHPGVTSTAKSGTGYTAIPVDLISGLTGTNTASHLYMTLRSVIALNGSLASGSCTSASGAATVSHMDNHTVGCELAAGGSCNATQYQFVDSNSPVLTASSATFQSVKMTTAATCPNVRSALP